jgi:hypothetical protein
MGKAMRPTGIGPHECLWIDEDKRSWLVRASFARVGERTEVVGMEVRSARRDDEDYLAPYLPARSDTAPGPVPINSTVWRAVGTLANELRHNYVSALDEAGLLDRVGNERSAAAWRAPRERVEARLEEVAAVYKAAAEAGRSTTDAVASHFGLSASAAGKRVQRAREAGHLPPTNRGRPRK